MKIIHIALKVFAWLSIVASPVLLGAMAAGVIYLGIRDTAGIIIAFVVMGASLLFGIVVATRIWKKQGTIEFISRISATPELDEPESEK